MKIANVLLLLLAGAGLMLSGVVLNEALREGPPGGGCPSCTECPPPWACRCGAIHADDPPAPGPIPRCTPPRGGWLRRGFTQPPTPPPEPEIDAQVEVWTGPDPLDGVDIPAMPPAHD